MIDIRNLDKAKVLAALYNRSKPQGMGWLHFDPAPMTVDEARALLEGLPNSQYPNFEYLKGRVMKVDLSGDEFDEWLYDRDNGSGAAQSAADSVREAV